MSEKSDDFQENVTTLDEFLKENGTLTYRNVGASMLPLLKQGRDIFTIAKKTDERCRKGDVALYRRKPHVYVLHRVIEVRENDYVLLGDNCIKKEYGITDSDIIGVMTEFVRKGKQCSVTDKGYLLYVHIWCALAPLRIFIKRVLSKIRKVL